MSITSFIIYCFIITFSPGPTHIVTLSTVHNYGIKKAINFCYGSSIAFGIIMILSVVLNSVLATVLPKFIIIMQIIGAIYILYLAYKIYTMDSSSNSKKDFASFKTGFVMQFINPKVVLFCVTVIPSFVMPYHSSFDELFLFAFIVFIIGTMSYFAWVLFGSILKVFLQRYQKITNTFMSLFLVYCAIMISGITNF
ncbi:LysE family translocator [Sulfurospirillum arcachonense]|uniref:LysE family translocator n=1 Tax=Sulfurospirillum arcachonense TaxID=57666 RepID=UPI000468F07E|nr:LysE family transporter [Sulfurospirillum arcachonense]